MAALLATTRGAIAALLLVTAALIVDPITDDDWTLTHALPFLVATPLLVVLLALPRLTPADLVGSAVGASLGLAITLWIASETEDSGTPSVGVAGLYFCMALVVCVGVVALARWVASVLRIS